MKHAFKLFITLLLLTTSSAFSTTPDSIATKINQAQEGFRHRWTLFTSTHPNFPLWNPDTSEQTLKSQFDQMLEDRWAIYFSNPQDVKNKGAFGSYNDLYQTPSHETWLKWHSRYPYPPIAFTYNLASPDYNASIINLHGLTFLALEAPAEGSLDAFFQLLTDYQVSHLVRLTPAEETHSSTGQLRDSSFPYWDDPTFKNIHFPYTSTDAWPNHHGTAPELLLNLVNAVAKNNPNDTLKPIAVHCRAGVGRTGTFIIAYTLKHLIDQQFANGIHPNHISISIDQIIWQLALQRAFAVTHFPQYLTLHNFVDYYINSLQSASNPPSQISLSPIA